MIRRRFRALAGLAAAGLLACAPKPLWTAKSPDRRHTVVLRDGASSASSQRLGVDGWDLGPHEAVAVSTFAFSPDGSRWAYAERRGSRWTLRASSGDQGEWDGIGGIRFSPRGDRLAFEAEREGRWAVVVDGKPGSWHESLVRDALTFSADGTHFAYAAVSGGRIKVRWDHDAYPSGDGFDGVGKLFLDPRGKPIFASRLRDSARVIWNGAAGRAYASITGLALDAGGGPAYLARRDGEWRFVSREAESPAYPEARDLALSRDGRAYAFIVKTSGGEAVIARAAAGADTVGPLFDAILPPVLSPDGTHWAYAGRNRENGFIVADGRVVAREEWAGAPALGAGGRIAYAARRGGRNCVVVDGKAWDFDVILDDTIQFSLDGRSWGCVAGRAADRKLFFMIDGRPWKPVDMAEVAGVAARRPADGGKDALKQWMAAELELARESISP